MCCSVENLYKTCPFLSWKSVQNVLFFLFFQNILLSAGRMRFYKNKRTKKNTFCWVEICPIMLRNRIGQIFNSAFFTCLAPFSFLKQCSNPIFIGLSAKITFLQPTPKIRNTICEHNCANWFFVCPFFSAFLVWGGFAVSGFFGLFLKIKQWTQNNQNRNNTTRCKPTSRLVLFIKRKQTTQTQNNAT